MVIINVPGVRVGCLINEPPSLCYLMDNSLIRYVQYSRLLEVLSH